MAKKITRIHVNQHVIRKNKKTGSTDPLITVKQGRTNRYAAEVHIAGPCKLVYRPEQPLDCGETCWVEVEGEVACR